MAKEIRKRQRESLLKSANLVILLPLLSSLFLFLNCKTEFVDPIPSFCATEADWGPNDVILFTNDPSKIVPPETGYQLDSAGLWAVNADGGEVRFLDAVTPDGVEVRGAPEWSPDGLWFVTSDLMGRVWLVSASADSFVKLTESGGIWRPALRPDGRKIAFSTSDSDALGPRGLRTLDLETGVKSFVFPYGMDPSGLQTEAGWCSSAGCQKGMDGRQGSSWSTRQARTPAWSAGRMASRPGGRCPSLRTEMSWPSTCRTGGG